jgi:Flp pilus assembly protein TadD
LANLKKASELSPDNRVLQADYAAVLTRSGQFEKALPILNRLLESHSGDLDALFLKASTQLQMGDRDGARSTTLKLLTLDPDYPVPPVLRDLL